MNGTRFKARRELFFMLLNREIRARYRGSWLGLSWSVVNPILLMLTYYLVFNFIFKSRLPGLYEEQGTPYAGVIFSGLIVYFLFSEVVTRTPTLIFDNANYVKKVVFPIEIIPLISVAASAFNFLISFLILVLFLLVFVGEIYITVLLIPLIVLPYFLFLCGLAWFLSAITVYIRDIGQVAGFFATAMLFLSPVFYVTQAVPSELQGFMMFNPLSYFIEMFRSSILIGSAPEVVPLISLTVFSAIFCVFGYWFFQRVRGGFADIL